MEATIRGCKEDAGGRRSSHLIASLGVWVRKEKDMVERFECDVEFEIMGDGQTRHSKFPLFESGAWILRAFRLLPGVRGGAFLLLL